MEQLFAGSLFIILIGFVISLLVSSKNERAISRVVFVTVGLHFLTIFALSFLWLWHGRQILNVKEIVLYKTINYEFLLDILFDKITAFYQLIGAFLTFLVSIYSRYYLHKEPGYKRFFNTVLFFYLGYNIVVTSGNFETLFLGWEILGISSFLLIAFYRNRYLPVKNAVKVFSIYRIGDVGLIMAMWMSHHLWHENITFQKLNNFHLVHEHLQQHTLIGAFISIMILMSAAAKSAQFPFTSWLPRAMEGPTPSSAIFYGSLSVHIGVFLMLRTFPFWEAQTSVRVLIVLMGLVTAILSSFTSRVQSSVKSQIAYSSVAQIGIIFIEIALGYTNLALIHFAGNAFLRTYQLLVSPSVVSYLIKEQFYHFKPHQPSVEDSLPKRIEYSLYILSLQEWKLDSLMYRFLWNPLKFVGKQLEFLSIKTILVFMTLIYGLGLYCVYHRQIIPENLSSTLSIFFAFIGLLLALKAFTERHRVMLSWFMVLMCPFWVALAISFNEEFSFNQVHLYLSGVIIAGLLGFYILKRLQRLELQIDLHQFHGHSYKHPKMAFIFLMACLAVSGFPITPTFIGEDLIFTHIHEGQGLLAFFIALIFIVDGLALVRIYARVFLGPHVKSQYDMAYRSS